MRTVELTVEATLGVYAPKETRLRRIRREILEYV
jgi:hypothetical protein